MGEIKNKWMHKIAEESKQMKKEEVKNNGGSFLLSMQEKEEIKNKWMHKIAEESKQMKTEEVKNKTETPLEFKAAQDINHVNSKLKKEEVRVTKLKKEEVKKKTET